MRTPSILGLVLPLICASRAQQSGRLVPTEGGVQDHERVAELKYRVDLRKGAYFIQPAFQYIVSPGGTGQLPNAPVFGAQFDISF